MDSTELKSFDEYLKMLQEIEKGQIVLFRGQKSNFPLIPKIARQDPTVDTTTTEREMLSELRRRGALYINQNITDDWDALVLAQHYGMATRLLDWSTNPLVALWFACVDVFPKKSSFVYVFVVGESLLLDRTKSPDPFKPMRTKVFKPNLNNPRIISQSGWFTAHRFSRKVSKFVALESNNEIKTKILEIKVPPRLRENFLVQLDRLGINYQSLFPDVEGVCRHINWLHDQ